MEEESVLDCLEKIGYDWAGKGILDAVSDIRGLNNKWWRGGKITNREKEKYFIIKSFLMDYLCSEEEDSQECLRMRIGFIKSLAMAVYYANLEEGNDKF